MPNIEIEYHAASNTFIGSDEHGNKITYKEDKERNELIPVSESTTTGPMTSLLMACGACSAIDIVMILGKQRQAFDVLKIRVSGEREKDKIPALWEKVHIHYFLKGDMDKEKAERAAALSVDKYCSVAETLRRAGAAVFFDVEVSL